MAFGTIDNDDPFAIVFDVIASQHWPVGKVMLGAESSVGTPLLESHFTNIVAAIQGTLTVAGQVTANAGTNLNTSLLALESGGNLTNINLGVAYLASLVDDGVQCTGDVSHDVADTGAGPVKIGGRARTSEPVAVADNDRVNAYFDANGRLHVVVDGSLPTGGNTIGNVGVAGGSVGLLPSAAHIGSVAVDAALPAGANNIGDVDVLTAPADPFGNNADAAATSDTGTFSLMALTKRGLQWDTTQAGYLQTLAGTVAGSEIQVDVLTLPNVVLAAGTNTNEVVGDAADDIAVSGNPVRIGARARRARRTTASADDDTVDVTADRYGRLQTVGIDVASIAAVQVTASGDTALVAAPTAGTRLKIIRVEASNSHATVAVTAGLKTNAYNANAVFGKKYLPALGGQAVWNFPGGHLLCGDNEAFNANLSAGSTTIEFTVYYEVVTT